MKKFVLSAAVLLAWAVPALAAAPEALDSAPVARAAPAIAPLEYQLDREMVVRNWVLCATQPVAESIVKAWSSGVDHAQAVYADLKAAKSCGQFPELHVILHQSVFQSGPEANHDARVFAAQVNLGGGWPNAFVVYGGLPEISPSQ